MYLQFVYFHLKYAIPNVIKTLFLIIVDDAVSVMVCLECCYDRYSLVVPTKPPGGSGSGCSSRNRVHIAYGNSIL